MQHSTAGRSGNANPINMVVRKDQNSESANLCSAWSKSLGADKFGAFLFCLFLFYFVCLMQTLHFQAHCALAGKRQPQGAHRDRLHWIRALLCQAVLNTSGQIKIQPHCQTQQKYCPLAHCRIHMPLEMPASYGCTCIAQMDNLAWLVP